MKARILWIEKKRAASPSFVSAIRKKDYFVETVPTGADALEHLSELEPDLVIVDAASLRSSGKRICSRLRDRVDGLPILLITTADQVPTGNVCANVVLQLPFTSRKLLNRIVRFAPGNGENVIRAGLIRLDMEKKQVRCQDREARLNPRLTRLLQVLMKHPGEAIERERLFREVWSTEYTEDTRTLDVHISWLRKAIEENPRKPQFLKTIRGLGYRLDV